MAPSRRIAAVAQWVSVMPRTIIPPILQHRGRILLQRFLHLRLVDLDLDAGALELQQHRHARVTLAPAAVERLRHLHQRQLAQPHRHPELAADGGGEAHVLVRQAQREARRLVLVLQEIVAEPVVETLAAVGALAHGFPDFAPRGPPLTGASSMCTPRSAKILLIRRTTVGEFVLRSKYALPRARPARMPLSPSATPSTSGGVGSEVKTTSLASATCFGESAHLAPAERCGLAASERRSCTTRSWPPFWTLVAM